MQDTEIAPCYRTFFSGLTAFGWRKESKYALDNEGPNPPIECIRQCPGTLIGPPRRDTGPWRVYPGP
jgi:hypothetical protein